MVEGGDEQFNQASMAEQANLSSIPRERNVLLPIGQLFDRLQQRKVEHGWQVLLRRPELPRDPIALLQRAKKGVAEFKQLYETGEPEWQQILTTRDVYGDGYGWAGMIQSMYLGLKPSFDLRGGEITPIEETSHKIMLSHLSQRFSVIGNKFVYDPELVAEVMARNPDIFTDYSSKKQTIDAYLQSSVVGTMQYVDTFKVIKKGLVYGYPRNAVIQFAKNQAISRFFSTATKTYTQQPLTAREQELCFRYAHGYKDRPETSLQEYRASINLFLDEHKEELRALVEKVFPGPTIPQNAKSYLLTERFIQLPGIGYLSGNPTPADYAFAQTVRDIFEQSGMNAYLASVQS